jgi:NAD(P)-dependent dehydrogenase (short-subunit alcohol dehydrogenase family)
MDAFSSPFSLQGHTALITGSSSGIGFASGLALREAGARVLFHGKEARPPGIPAEAPYFEVDLIDPEGIEKLAALAFRDDPPVDLLVLSAGGFFDVPFLEVTPAVWEKTFALNVRSAYFLAQAFARHRARRGGAIVLVSSTNGFLAEPDSTVYDTSKGALVMLTRTLAVALAPLGIRVNGLAPGVIRTELTSGWIDRNQALRTLYEDKILLGRVGQPQECATACVFLCSDAANYVNGHVLVVDGGLTCTQVGRLPGRVL